jgi:hypothetical protein
MAGEATPGGSRSVAPGIAPTLCFISMRPDQGIEFGRRKGWAQIFSAVLREHDQARRPQRTSTCAQRLFAYPSGFVEAAWSVRDYALGGVVGNVTY